MATVAKAGSTVPRRQLGRYLRNARKQARMTIKTAATALERSEATMWRIESGQVAMRGLDVEGMCRTYGVPAELTGALVALAMETKARGWWHAYGDVIPEWFNVFVGLEESASHIGTYDPLLVPGLLQTADYARTVIASFKPGLEPDEVERRVDLRMARQVLLTRTSMPLAITVVIEESALRRRLPKPRVMAEQCRRLAELSELPHVDLRILGPSAGLHPGVETGPFVVLRFPTDGEGRDTEPATVYIQEITGALYLDRPHEVERYDEAFRGITAAADNATTSSREILWRLAQEVME